MKWGNLFTPRDSRGRESRTLFFVSATWLFMTLRFIAGGLHIALSHAALEIGSTTLVDYGAAVAAILSVWVARDWVKQQQERKI